MSEAAPEAGGSGWWCRTCDLPVRVTGGGGGLGPEFRRTFHLATGQEEGPGSADGADGRHIAVPTDQSPGLRAEAAKVRTEFGEWFHVTTGFGRVRVWIRQEFLPPGVILPETYYGRDADELRPQLTAALPPAGGEQVPSSSPGEAMA